ncbi:MAG: cupin domain-containing protein [Nostoc sp. NOS(2021)]|nr:cupin domain-containing protein [Nostoc sp. NOS(2021)]
MQNNSSHKPTIDYWHVWTDHNGISHQSRCQIEDFIQKGIAPDTSPQWLSDLKQSGATITFTVLPVGWVGNWHENPKPQWVIPLSGRWFVETMDGQRVEMGPGEISFGEDQGTKADAQGHKGHLSGTVGDAPAVLIMVQLEETPTIDQSCRFR